MPASSGGIARTIRVRLLAFGLVVGMGFLLIVSLVVSAGISALGQIAAGSFPGEESLLQVINTALSFGVITLIFAMIYKLLPRATVHWKEVWHGGAFTAGLFSIGKFIIGLYIGNAALASSFGAAGTFVVLLAWIYYSAQIFLFGAEVTYHHAQFLRSRRAGGAGAPSRPSGA